MIGRGGSAGLLAMGVLMIAGCGDHDPSPVASPSVPTAARAPAGSPSDLEPRDALLVVGTDLNESEERLVEHLEAQAFAVTIIDDDDLADADAVGRDLVVMSKTVLSTTVGTSLKSTCSGVLFWEDNQQMLSMMATIDETDLPDTAWHGRGTDVYVDPAADVGLRAGLSGAISLLSEPDEITYAPRRAGTSLLPPQAIRIAEFDAAGEDRWAIYAFEADAALADGSPSAGRRYYFGLYDDTFRLLTEDGLALFDAAVEWTADAAARDGCPAGAG